MALSDSEKLYCQKRAEGALPKYQCYLEAFRLANKGSAQTLSTRLEKRPEIALEIKRLQDATETKNTLSRQEKREFFAAVVRANLAELTEDSPLLESVTRFFDKQGNLQRVVLKLPSKAECIRLDNVMAGHNEPEEHHHTIEGGVMVLPAMPSNMEDFEKTAVEQQRALKESCI